ncbi:MAG: helical backbone metal receptor [Opitutaceae bacterium]|jgi:iron complex transport system substrate-binding protein|nr:helical backbone metal receptor [Opitutaceae bacterium]
MVYRSPKSRLPIYIFPILALFATGCIATGCTAAHCIAAARDGAFPLTFTDGLGRAVTLKARPQRIISLTPSNTEMLFAVGNGANVAGDTRFCDYPDAAKTLPKIGGFAARTISIEAIIALKPDLVVAGDKSQETVIEALERLGIPVIASAVTDYESLYAALELHGKIAGRETGAAAVIREIRRRVEAVRARAAEIPKEKRLRVYWETFDEPLMSAGPRSFVGQQIALAGGMNIFADARETYPHVSAEAVIARDPQIILAPGFMGARPILSLERLLRRPGWQNITAVRERRMVVLPDNLVSRAGPRLVEGLELMAAALYPEYFGTKPAAGLRGTSLHGTSLRSTGILPVGSSSTGILPVGLNRAFAYSQSSNPTGETPVLHNPMGETSALRNPTGWKPVLRNPTGETPALRNPTDEPPAPRKLTDWQPVPRN